MVHLLIISSMSAACSSPFLRLVPFLLSTSKNLGHQSSVLDLVRLLSMLDTFQPVENFLVKLMIIAGKQNLNRLRKCSRKWQFYHLFYILESKEEI